MDSPHWQAEPRVWMMPTRMKTPIRRNSGRFKLNEETTQVNGAKQGQGDRGKGPFALRLLPFVLCLSPFALCLSPFAFCPLPFRIGMNLS